MTILSIAEYTDDDIDDAVRFVQNLGHMVVQKSRQQDDLTPVIDRNKLKRVLDEIGVLPESGLFIGVSEDGMPILLDLDNPQNGGTLFVADKYSGKTMALKSIAAGIEFSHLPQYVKFAVLTDNVNKWKEFKNSPNLIGIFSVYQPVAETFINGLASWAHVNNDKTQTVILLIDGIQNLDYLDTDTQQNIQWILQNGAEHRVWTFGSLRAVYWLETSWHREFSVFISGYMPDESLRLLSDESFLLQPAQEKNTFYLPNNVSYNVAQFAKI